MPTLLTLTVSTDPDEVELALIGDGPFDPRVFDPAIFDTGLPGLTVTEDTSPAALTLT